MKHSLFNHPSTGFPERSRCVGGSERILGRKFYLNGVLTKTMTAGQDSTVETAEDRGLFRTYRGHNVEKRRG